MNETQYTILVPSILWSSLVYDRRVTYDRFYKEIVKNNGVLNMVGDGQFDSVIFESKEDYLMFRLSI